MRVFFLTTEFPWPASAGGRVRTLSQLRLLVRQPEIGHLTLFSLTEEPVRAAEQEALLARLRAERSGPELRVLPPPAHPVHLKRRPAALLGVAAMRIVTGAPYLSAKWQSTAVRRALVQALSGAPYDLVYIDHLGMAGYLPDIRRHAPGARVVLEEHNVESDFFRQYAERLPPPLRPGARLEHQAAARFEARALTQVDAVVAISETDAADLRRLVARYGPGRGAAPRPIHAVPPVVTSGAPARPDPGVPRLCYVGSLSWHPNAQGLDWFCTEVWPRVRAELPAAELVIAGSGLRTDAAGRPRVPRAWQAPGIEVRGYVEDLEPLYAGSRAMIAPILGGSGVRIKLLEAFRAGMPVVTTPAGAAGLRVTSGVELLVEPESEPERFARAVRTLLSDGALRERLRAAGYRYLAANHAPAHADAALRAALGLPV